MSVTFQYSELWTYCSKPESGRVSIENLNDHYYTHIHGDLSIVIDDNILPRMGFGADEVCFGYWIEQLLCLYRAFKEGKASYTIEGMDQGMPAYLFEKDGQSIYLSIVDSVLGGKADLSWQKVKINFKELNVEFRKLQDKLYEEIKLKAPGVLKKWEAMLLKNEVT